MNNNKNLVLKNATNHSLEKYGEGIISNYFNNSKKLINKIVYGRNEYSPSAQKVLDTIGNAIISKITIGRTPVQDAITNSLRLFTNVPYDTLFHLFILIETSTGIIVKIEKTAQIVLTINPLYIQNTETYKINFSSISINDLLTNTKKYMGGKYFTYSASSNNCQDFIKSIFESNNISQGIDFIKQNTESIFADHPNLRKFTNTITDLGSKIDVIQQGGQIYKLSSFSKSLPSELEIRCKKKSLKG
jgi:hypothetical protein